MTDANYGVSPPTSRTLRAMNEYSKAVEAGLDDKQLLQRICDIFVEFGDIRIAWIGYLESGSPETIRLMAQAGGEHVPVDDRIADWKDVATVAIRTGHFCNRGELLSLPLKSNDLLLGALTLHANRPDHFDPENMELLNGFANNIARELAGIHTQEQRRATEETLRQKESGIRQLVDAIPQHIMINSPNGLPLFANKAWTDFHGQTVDDLRSSAALDTIHADDVQRMLGECARGYAGKVPFETEFRLRRKDGQYRAFLFRLNPLEDQNGNIVRWYSSATDIEDLKRATQELERSAYYLVEGQRLAHIGSWAFTPSGIFDYWSPELYRIYGFDPAKGAPTLEQYLAIVHPQDYDFVAETIEQMRAQHSGCDVKKRIIRPDGELRYIRFVSVPVLGSGVLKGFLGTAVDITEQERLTQQLQQREAYLTEAQRLSQTGSFGWNIASGELLWSVETFRIFEYEKTTRPTLDLVFKRVHPEDVAFVKDTIERTSRDGKNFDLEHRLLMPDASVKSVHVVAQALRTESGNIEYVGAVMDTTAAKQAELKIRKQEVELRQALDLAPQHVSVLGPDGSRLYMNQVGLTYLGLTLDEWRRDQNAFDFLHPDDRERAVTEPKEHFFRGIPHEIELRQRRYDGEFRWFLFRLSPLRDEQGRISSWYIAGTDIEDRKRGEEKLRQENLALREEIDKVSMLEQIVGSSPALQVVISRLSKVAPTDSTVLITGDTGTGKELIARAVHKRSQRSSRAFVSVNCAAIPRDLIASELFGHEKGSFTGALQRRLGRFELAEGGTLFLDEVGELPVETQIILLRVLQEREFERVGGSQPIHADVRVIAATNRDLETAISTGTFRRDLYYRLNVFPIEIPTLGERREDIPMLVEYFIDRYARKAGKKIRTIDRTTLELLQSYSWPGNIRELQNVIERSVIVCETDTFSVDPSWLNVESSGPRPANQPPARFSTAQEKQRIETALAESAGRVSGPSGAAVILGIPASTLETKIRSLRINKFRFKSR